jgi:TOMM system kinase/cyclase fusion protein
VIVPPENGEPERPSRIAQYRVEQRLGHGGMGAVYRAFDETLQRAVALKRLLPSLADPSLTLRFRREARMAARLNHPAIVHIYEIVEAADCEWIVMELVEGKTIDRLMREARLPVVRVVRLAREIAEGLAEAHAQGIVHRDLKASNVMVTGSGRVKILDFGLAKVYSGELDAEISAPGAVVGTVHAMSPEQAQGLMVDHRSDLFALGSLLYEMLTGASPFHAATPPQTLARICTHDPSPVHEVVRGVPRELSDLAQRLLQKSAARRPQTTHDVVMALERIERSAAVDRFSPSAAETALHTKVDAPPASAGTGERPRAHTNPSVSSLERRQMTVLCCEPADAGQPDASSHGFDAETLYELMLQLRPIAQAVAQRYEGSLANLVGQRLLLYFGHPVAHEDDAWRAVRAALDLVHEAGVHMAADPDLAGTTPALRVGIHTGTAVASTNPLAAEPVVLGPMLDIALHLLASAEPGTVVASAATRALVHRGIAVEACPPLTPVAGGSEPLQAFVIREASEEVEETILDGAPLVGRDRELDLMLTRWAQAQSGTGQAVVVSGEPGMGKSRLLRALRERIATGPGGEEVRWLAVHGSPYTQNTPLHLAVQLLHRAVGTGSSSGSSATPLQQLDDLLHGLGLSEALPLFAAVLDVPADVRPAVTPMPPERQREETLDALVALLLEMAERKPVVLLVEDLHWFDPSSLAWLDRLIDHASTAPLLLVMTMRPNSLEVPWAARAQVTQVSLTPLTSEDTARLIGLLSGGRALEADLQRQIVDRTDGVPLFVEELTRSALESGGSAELPTTLRDSLTVRLDRLGAAKEVAQLASVIGRTFSLPLLAAIAPHDLDTLERELRHLVQSGLVHRRGFGIQTRYSFKHALIRDAAYDSLLKRERQHLHLHLAEALESSGPSSGAARPELLAHHYAEGNKPDRAVACRLDAARQALGRSAHQEALQHVRAGLALLRALPHGAARDGLELQLQTTRLPGVIASQGFASPEVEQAYTRGLELCNDDQARFGLLYGLYSFHAVQARPDVALPQARRMMDIADAQANPVFKVQSGYALGAMLFLHGEPLESRQHLAVAIVQNDPSLDSLLPQSFGTDDRKTALAYDALDLWMLGHPAEALERAEAAVRAARAAGQPFTLTTVLLLTGFLHRFRRDSQAVRRQAEEMLALTQHHGLYQSRDANVLLGIALATDSDDVVAGAQHLRRSLDAYRATGFRVFVSFYQAELAAACLQHGRLDEANTALDEAFATFANGSELFWSAELQRLRGEILAARGEVAEAEACFRTALELAQRHGAVSLELRSATSLARLGGAQARDVLAHARARVDQDVATADLAEAEALLATLG